MNGPRKGRHQLARLAAQLSERDKRLIQSVGEHRLLSARQIERLHFPVPDSHASPISAARTARRVLERLTRDRLLIRLSRRIGGVRAGSASFVYAIGPLGQRVVGRSGPRRRFREPSAMFVAHTLAVAELFVRITEAEQAGLLTIKETQAEPRSWRQFSGLTGRTIVKPDLFLALESGGYDLRWFIEVDLGTEHQPAILRKCQTYEAYYRTGIEQARQQVFPRVLWVVSDDGRALQISQSLHRSAGLTPELFVVTTAELAVRTLTGTSDNAERRGAHRTTINQTEGGERA